MDSWRMLLILYNVLKVVFRYDKINNLLLKTSVTIIKNNILYKSCATFTLYLI